MGNGPNRAFGRRALQQGVPGQPGRASASAPPTPEPLPPAAGGIVRVEHDLELEDWKRARRWQPPWRQIAFTASVCFGVAALILPDTVNDGVQLLLYGLTAASFWAGWRKRRA
jgi:hypothetical protein